MSIEVRMNAMPPIRLENLVWASEPFPGGCGPHAQWLIAVHTCRTNGRVAKVCDKRAGGVYEPTAAGPIRLSSFRDTGSIQGTLFKKNEAAIRRHVCPVYVEPLSCRPIRFERFLHHYADGSMVDQFYYSVGRDGSVVSASAVPVPVHDRAVLAMRARAWRASG